MSNDPIHIVGAGLGGLTAAAVLASRGQRVVVHESRRRLGGRATTDHHDGFGFNRGPHAFYVGGEGVQVLARLGIRPTGVVPDTSTARMVVDGVSHLAPGGLLTLARTTLLGWRDKLALGRTLGTLPKLEPAAYATTTTREWIDSVTDRPRVREVIDCVVRLTSYTDLPDRLSADVAIRQLQLGLGTGVRYLDRGWEQLVEALLAVAPSIEIVTGAPVTALPDAPVVIVSTGGPAAATALTGYPYDPGTPADVSCLDLCLARPPANEVVLGIEPRMYLSNHGGPAGLTPPGGWSVSIAQYLSDDVVPDRAGMRAFAAHAGIAEADVVEERHLHRMTAASAIATASGGGLGGRPGVAVPGQPGRFVVGDWVGPVGHLADAVLASAESAAHAAIRHLESMARVG